MCQTGARVRRNTNSFRRKILPWYLFSYWLVAGTLLLVLRIGINERGGLISCEVHVAHAISALQTKLSTAVLVCNTGCCWLYMIWCSRGDWKWEPVGCDVSSLTRLFLYTSASRAVDWIDFCIHSGGLRTLSGVTHTKRWTRLFFVHARCNVTTTATVIGHWSGVGYYSSRSDNSISVCPALHSLFFSPEHITTVSAMFSTPFPRPPAIAPEVSAAPERLQTTVIASRARGGHPHGCTYSCSNSTTGTW